MGRGSAENEQELPWKSPLEAAVGKTVVAIDDGSYGLGGGHVTITFDDGSRLEVLSETDWDYGSDGDAHEYSTLSATLHDPSPPPVPAADPPAPAENKLDEKPVKPTLFQRLSAELDDQRDPKFGKLSVEDFLD